MDTGGYVLSIADLAFLGISLESVRQWRERETPLGMETTEFEVFVSTLSVAFHRDDIDKYDVRIQGSSANFFSGLHKSMPWSRDDVFEAIRLMRKPSRAATSVELDRIEGVLNRRWPSSGCRPTQRPFDVMYRLGISRSPSDIDIQVSSQEISDRVLALLVQRGLNPEAHRINNPNYDFIQDYLVRPVCEHLFFWAAHVSEILRRTVSIRIFPECGPPDRTEQIGELSSHFRTTDWQIGIPNHE